ncbi:MAG TPA: hypothetical protein VFH61_17845, partial [Thermoleophilia bacterium]|nr:hypothetical protein [Thermoleophilia bacterium]
MAGAPGVVDVAEVVLVDEELERLALQPQRPTAGLERDLLLVRLQPAEPVRSHADLLVGLGVGL